MSLARRHKEALLAAGPQAAAATAETTTIVLPPLARPDGRSLATRHRARVLAAAAVLAAGNADRAANRPADGSEATAYELLLAKLGEDLRRLGDVQGTDRKIEIKAEMIGAYDDHVLATLAAIEQTGTAVQDLIVSTMMIWRLDIGDYATALDIAEFVLRYGIDLPERFNRTAGCLVAEEVAEGALAAFGQDTDFALDILQRTVLLTEKEDMPNQARAKLFKAVGKALLRDAATLAADSDGPAGGQRAAQEAALAAFRRALHLNVAIGVKKEIEKLEVALKKPVEPHS